ncbi:MAG: hypothetical protein NXH97_17015 [Rhodobacteraceae bacterium]|nr:hypothetical protein [Paracoccaceae bacterium]
MTTIRVLLVSAVVLSASVAIFAPAQAKQIERACVQSDRSAANRQTCRCIQRVADQVLTGSDQKRAAGFFRDPDKAQETRMSDRSRDEQFWTRYRAFGNSASAICG